MQTTRSCSIHARISRGLQRGDVDGEGPSCNAVAVQVTMQQHSSNVVAAQAATALFCWFMVGLSRQASTRLHDCSILSDPVPSREQGFFSLMREV